MTTGKSKGGKNQSENIQINSGMARSRSIIGIIDLNPGDRMRI